MSADLPKRSFKGPVVVHLQDELRGWGSGRQICTASVGSRWVRLRKANGKRARMSKERFKEIFIGVFERPVE